MFFLKNSHQFWSDNFFLLSFLLGRKKNLFMSNKTHRSVSQGTNYLSIIKKAQYPGRALKFDCLLDWIILKLQQWKRLDKVLLTLERARFLTTGGQDTKNLCINHLRIAPFVLMMPVAFSSSETSNQVCRKVTCQDVGGNKRGKIHTRRSGTETVIRKSH